MTAILLDTSVASLLHPKRRSSPQRARYEPFLRGHIAALSFQTVAELWAWAEQRAWAQPQRTALGAFLARFVLLPHTDELNRAWALVMTQARRAGRRLEAGDGWIAATAVHYSVPLLTQDADFVGLGVTGLELVAVAAP
ncbi:MAG: PIN domain-containing protein [Myxococcales bacterium]|nr:PIN domain-containing protein [Myxococcales bacterium]